MKVVFFYFSTLAFIFQNTSLADCGRENIAQRGSSNDLVIGRGFGLDYNMAREMATSDAVLQICSQVEVNQTIVQSNERSILFGSVANQFEGDVYGLEILETCKYENGLEIVVAINKKQYAKQLENSLKPEYLALQRLIQLAKNGKEISQYFDALLRAEQLKYHKANLSLCHSLFACWQSVFVNIDRELDHIRNLLRVEELGVHFDIENSIPQGIRQTITESLSQFGLSLNPIKDSDPMLSVRCRATHFDGKSIAYNFNSTSISCTVELQSIANRTSSLVSYSGKGVGRSSTEAKSVAIKNLKIVK